MYPILVFAVGKNTVHHMSIHDFLSHSFHRLHSDVVGWINAEVRSGR